MRIKLLSFLLISSFLFGSLPIGMAQEVMELPVPVETVDISLPEPVTETGIPESSGSGTEDESNETNNVLGAMEPVIEESRIEEVEIEEAEISLLIRHGENIAWSGTTTLPADGTITVTPTGGTEGIEIAADSLLAVLLALDATTDDFTVSDLDYFSSFDSFLVNCISSNVFPEACGQWQYVIDGQYPFIGIDKYELEADDEVFLYFGSPRRVTLADSSIAVNEPFTAAAESYDPETDTYSPLPGYTIGVTQPNPDNPWSPLEIATSTSGALGTAEFTLAVEGSYDIGLQEDFYFPSTAFTVTAAGSTDPDDGGTGGGSAVFDVDAAYDFLATGQDEDGSWDSELVTDWSAIALAVSGAPSSMKSALVSFLKEEEPDLDSVRDYERHAMALMALNINPYTGGPSDYVTPIAESFDGTQIDDAGLVNDDVFALIVLMHAGYDTDDDMIRNITAFIVSEQKDNGSWENSVDMTAATVQALSEVRSLPEVESALRNAESYLRASQNPDGGFDDPFGTSWALQAIEALDQSPSDWKVGGNTPLTYLAREQEDDGGLRTTPDDYSTRAWAIAYAIPAVKGLTWNEALRDFKIPEPSKDEKDAIDDEAGAGAATTTSETAILPVPVEREIEPLTATAYTTPSAESITLADASLPIGTVLTAPDEGEGPMPEGTVGPKTLTASAAESGAWEWIKRFLSSLWSFIADLLS